MVQELEPPAKKQEKGGRSWLIIFFFTLFIIWMIYVGSQNQKADSMPANMDGMSSENNELNPTEMPDDMSGMNHP
jgi:hypothetical protein